MISSPLIFLLLTSCTSPLAESTPAQVTPTPAPSLIPPTTTPTPLPPPISPDFPTGIFFHRHAPSVYCIFQFNPDSTFAYYWMASTLDLDSIEPSGIGTYTIEGNLYHETYTDYGDCPPVTYTWTYDGQALTFQVVGEEACPDRQQTYESPLLYTKMD